MNRAGVPVHHLVRAAPQFHLAAAASAMDGRNRTGVVVGSELADLDDMATFVHQIETVVGHPAPPSENNMAHHRAECGKIV